MTKLECSPLPWAIEKLEAGDYAIIDATGDIIAEPDYERDARLIVAAVNSRNSRDELLAAAKAIIASCKRHMSYEPGIAEYEALEDAIAKAEKVG